MELRATLALAGIALLLLMSSGFINARRGIGRWSLVPWDYVMMLAALLLIALAAHAAELWRDAGFGWG
jgi:hypothetical protein